VTDRLDAFGRRSVVTLPQQLPLWLGNSVAYGLSAAGVGLLAYGMTRRRAVAVGVGLLSVLGLIVLAVLLTNFRFDEDGCADDGTGGDASESDDDPPPGEGRGDGRARVRHRTHRTWNRRHGR
jgi:hypothetical protein